MQGLGPTFGRGGLPGSVLLLRLGAPRSELTSELCPRNRQAGGAERIYSGWRRGMAFAEYCPLWICFRAKAERTVSAKVQRHERAWFVSSTKSKVSGTD